MNNKIKILIVEHDTNDIELMRYELEKSGIHYESEIVQTEQDFCSALKIFIPDIILSDYSLPTFDGPTALKIKEKVAPDTPFIFVSGTIGEERAVELIKNGATDYTLKDKLFALTPKIIRALKEADEKKEKRIADELIVKNQKQKEFDKNNLNALINNTKDLMWSVDRDFNLITSNKPFDEMAQVNFGNIIEKGGNVLSVAYSIEMLNHFKQLYERAFAGESFVETDYFDIPVEFWSEISYCPIHKGDQVIGAACHSRDITDRKRTEENLKKSEAFNRGVLNSLKSHIAVVNALGNIIAVNETWKRFAIENGETTLQRTGVGSNYFNVCIKSANDGDEIAAKALQGMKDIMEEKISFFSLEYPCHSPDKQRWFEMRVMKFDSDEQLIVIAHTDISELKKAEYELANTLIELEHRVEARTKELFDKNKDILDSINYAKRIQVGLLSPYSLLHEIFPKSFILSLPRDIVSGDFFWCYKRHTKKFIVVADCTGHGVPGALMSIIGNNLLNNIIVNEHIENPSEILEQLDMRLKQAIKGDEEEVKDGMDIALCMVDTHFNEFYFVGANRPVFISDKNGKVVELLPDRNTVGGGFLEDIKKFETKRFPIISGQHIYLSSDGYVSQFGGINNKKFMKSRFIKALEEFQNQPIDQQKRILQNVLTDWMGSNEQVDDVMVVGIEL